MIFFYNKPIAQKERIKYFMHFLLGFFTNVLLYM